ncbi:homeobox protein Hox-D9 [Arapaima gigas]
MSTSSALSNYYVDSIIGHEAEEVYGARFVPGSHASASRPSDVGDNADFSSCSYASKSAVFPTSWSSVHPPSTAAVSGIYHPYVHQSHLTGPDNRYVRSWIEPISSSVSFSGLHSSGRHYGAKPQSLPPKRSECPAFEAQTPLVPDYMCGAAADSKDKATKEANGSDILSQSESREEKQQQQQQQQLDPSNPAANWIHARSTRKKRRFFHGIPLLKRLNPVLSVLFLNTTLLVLVVRKRRAELRSLEAVFPRQTGTLKWP